MNIKSQIAERNELCNSIRKIIVERLMLDIPVDFISNDQPLVGRGLELDSIDSLEISVAVNMEMDITITDNSSDIFSSVNRMADFIENERAKVCA
ncbi:MAG: phosphopantetheine-binding protein [Coriobacteriales bacterium]|jgi:acyl carrier protein|nr:phosphopantetheine-binding protein [Coriobacteriales bacterium]